MPGAAHLRTVDRSGRAEALAPARGAAGQRPGRVGSPSEATRASLRPDPEIRAAARRQKVRCYRLRPEERQARSRRAYASTALLLARPCRRGEDCTRPRCGSRVALVAEPRAAPER